jgi:hypothetical protein
MIKTNGCIIIISILAMNTSFADNAKVIKIQNRVERQDSANVWSKLRFGVLVYEQETVKTYEQAKVTLLFESGSKISLDENSCLTLSENKEDQKTSQALWGKFDFEVSEKDKKSNFKVVTPVAVAGAEGTKFSVTVNKLTGETMIVLFNGKLRITSLDERLGEMLLMPNQLININRGSSSLKAAPIPESYRHSGQGGQNTVPSQQQNAVPGAEDRLNLTGQSASGGFTQPTTEEQQNQIVLPPTEKKEKSKVIIEINK